MRPSAGLDTARCRTAERLPGSDWRPSAVARDFAVAGRGTRIETSMRDRVEQPVGMGARPFGSNWIIEVVRFYLVRGKRVSDQTVTGGLPSSIERAGYCGD